MDDFTKVLLTSENHIKSVSPLSDNLAGKYILPTIKLVQDIELAGVIGNCLLRALQEKVADDSIKLPENLAYKDLLDHFIQPYMTYMVLSEVTDLVANKIANAGVVQTDDEHITNSYREERNDLKLTYLRYADSYKRIMQAFLLENRNALPELEDCVCERIISNLNTAYSGGLWLGGRRGKTGPRSCGC